MAARSASGMIRTGARSTRSLAAIARSATTPRPRAPSASTRSGTRAPLCTVTASREVRCMTARLLRREPERHLIVDGELLAGLDGAQRDEVDDEIVDVPDELAVRCEGVVEEAREPKRDGRAALVLVEVLLHRAVLPHEHIGEHD